MRRTPSERYYQVARPEWAAAGAATGINNGSGKPKGLNKALTDAGADEDLRSKINGSPKIRGAVQTSMERAFGRKNDTQLEVGAGSYGHSSDILEDEDLMVVMELRPGPGNKKVLRVMLVNSK